MTTLPDTPYPIPANEEERVATLREMRILDTLPQEAFDSLTALAAGVCGTQVALLSLVDADRQWFKSHRGIEMSGGARDESFCAHTIMDTDEVMVVHDATLDDRFRQFQMVQDGQLVFYAGAPIVTATGAALGAICVIDNQPRVLNAEQLALLKHLATLALQLIEHEYKRREQSEVMVAQIMKNQQIVRDVLNEGRDMACFIDRQHSFLFVNPAFRRYWMREPKDMLGTRVQDLMDPERYAQLYRPSINQALAGHESSFELEAEFPGMGLRYLEITHIPARESGGWVHGVVERARDITQRMQSERELADAIKELQAKRLANRKYVFSVSHDLKEPVNAIANATDVLTEAALERDDPLELRCLGIARAAAGRLARILEDLRLYSEVDTSDLRMHSHGAQNLYAEAMTQMRPELQSAGVTVDLAVQGLLRVDAPLMSLAIRSVLENMLGTLAGGTAMAADPVVTIRSQEDLLTHRVDITARLNAGRIAGTGPARDAAQARRQALRDVREIGLGLSIASHIIDLHQGELQIELQSDGHSRYSVILPRPTRAVEATPLLPTP